MSCVAGDDDGSQSGRDADLTSNPGRHARETLGDMRDLNAITEAMRRFTDDRDWSQFHDPKSLVLALVGEVGEVAELVQWLPAATAIDELKQEPLRMAVSAELADVLLYLVRLADVLDVDLATAAMAKMARNEQRFPVDSNVHVAPRREERR